MSVEADYVLQCERDVLALVEGASASAAATYQAAASAATVEIAEQAVQRDIQADAFALAVGGNGDSEPTVAQQRTAEPEDRGVPLVLQAGAAVPVPVRSNLVR